jgi:hypothetical protein
MQILLHIQDSLRVNVILTNAIGVENDMQMRRPTGPTARTVRQNAGGSPQHIAREVSDRRRAVASDDAGEDILNEIFDIIDLSNTASKETGEPSPHGLCLARQLGTTGPICVVAFHRRAPAHKWIGSAKDHHGSRQ